MGKDTGFNLDYEQEKTENPLTSFGGFPLFLEFLKVISFEKFVQVAFPKIPKQGFSPLHHILSIVLINLSGGESVSDIELLERDSGLKRLIKLWEKSVKNLKRLVFRKGRTRTFPSQSRLFEFLSRFQAETEEQERQTTPEGKSKILPVSPLLNGLKNINQQIISRAQELSPKDSATLDIDNNLIVSNKKKAKISYKGEDSYHPINVYWYEQDMMIHSEFRDGNVPAGLEQQRILEEALKILPSCIKTVLHRSDTAGYQHKFLEWMDSGVSRVGRIEFAVCADVSKGLRAEALALDESDWKEVYYSDKKGNRITTGQEVAELVYVPGSSNHKKDAPTFRYLVTREAINVQYQLTDDCQLVFSVSKNAEKKLHLELMQDKVYKVFATVTNMSGTPLEILLWQRKRCGQSEQEYSRLTRDMAGGRMPSGGFGQNAARWWLSIISLNLLKLFQREVLPKKYKRSRIKILDRILFRVAIKVVKASRSLKIKIPFDSAFSDLIDYARTQLELLKRRISNRRALQNFGIP